MTANSFYTSSATRFLVWLLACALISPVVRFASAQVPGHEILPPTSMAKGSYYLSTKQYQQALRLFKELVQKEPSNNYVFRSLALAWDGLGQIIEGEAYLKDYLSAHPMSGPAMYGLGFLYYLDGRWDESEQLLNKAIASDPENALALNNMGAVYAQQKNFFKAEALVKKAIGYRPTELMFYKNLFGVYKEAGAKSKFAYEFHQRVRKNSTVVARGYGITLARHKRQEGFRLYSQGKLNETIDTFLELFSIYSDIKRDSGIIASLFSLGILYEEQGDLIKARQSYNNLLKINPKHLQAQERIKLLKKD